MSTMVTIDPGSDGSAVRNSAIAEVMWFDELADADAKWRNRVAAQIWAADVRAHRRIGFSAAEARRAVRRVHAGTDIAR